MIIGRDRVPSLLVLVVGLAGGAALHAQSAEAPAATNLPLARAEVVRLEVVVTEKRGRPRAGLGREDFAVFEDGKPQPIVQFQAFSRSSSTAPAETAPAETAPAGDEETTSELLPQRYVVLVIDDVHMETDSVARVRKALRRFLAEDLRPEDQVALATTSGEALSQEFTSSRAALQATLSRLSGQGRHADWQGVPHISEYQAELIEAGDGQAFEAAVQEIVAEDVIKDRQTAENVARHKASAIFSEAVHGSRVTLETLESVCRGLSGLSGRKTLYLVSDGFLTGLSAQSGAGYDLRRIADAATRAGVAIYSLNTRGLVTSGVSASNPAQGMSTIYGPVEEMRQRSELALRDAMNGLAADTGGYLFENSNNLHRGLQEILKDSDTYYVIAYEPTNTRRDGGFRRIEVRLPGVRGVKIRTRSGYFAPDDRRATAVAAATADQARRAEQRRVELGAALGALAPLTAVPLRLAADFVSLDGAKAQLVVNGSIDVGTLPFVRRGDRWQATIETVAAVYDPAGRVLSTMETQRTTLDLTEADHQRLLRQGVAYTRAVSLPPGRYQVRAATRDEATGILGSASQTVDLPDLGSGRLAMSSLFLLKDTGPSAAASEPSAAPVLESVQGRPRFGSAESLYVELQAYNPKRKADGGVDLVAQAEILRNGAVLGTAAPEPMVTAERGGVVGHVSRIRLRQLERGEYELLVTVTDRVANAMVMRTVAFAVE